MRKVAIVTGGSGTIGSEISRKLSTEYDVVVAYKKAKFTAHKLLSELSGNPYKIQVDLTSLSSIKKLFADVKQKYNRIDLLVNNATFTQKLNYEELDSNIINEIIDLNIKSTFYCSREFLNYATNDGSSIINIGSNSVQTLNASNVIYIACKAGIESLTKSFAKDYGKLIRTNCVHPGLVKSETTETWFEETKQKVIENTPMKQMASAEDVAQAVYSLAVDLKLVNGQILNVDGGRTL